MTVSPSVLQGYQWVAGFADSATGLCLLVLPRFTMGMLGIELSDTEVPLISYIGVFVLGIGVSYFLCGKLVDSAVAQVRWSATWRFTATCRTLVVFFLVWQISSGQYQIQWLAVALSDAVMAGIQWVGLWKGWLGKAGSR